MKEILGAIAFYQAIRDRDAIRRILAATHFASNASRLKAESASCDWFMRLLWIPGTFCLSARQREEHLTEQALRDGLSIRELIFRGFPQVQRAELKVYRKCEDGDHEIVMTGLVHRETEVLPRVASLVMRAKLYGFRFSLDGGALERMGSTGVHAGC